MITIDEAWTTSVPKPFDLKIKKESLFRTLLNTPYETHQNNLSSGFI
jgi:hypothetical protein